MTSPSYASLIPTFVLFEGFTAAGAERLIEHGHVREIPAGTVLFNEGDAASGVLLVLAGDLQVFVRRGPKDLVLTSAVPGAIPRGARSTRAPAPPAQTRRSSGRSTR